MVTARPTWPWTATNAVGGSTSLNILLSNGDGTFQASVVGIISTLSVSSVIAADFNNDHKLDLVIATSTGFSIYLGNGNGSFVSPVPYSTGSFPFNNTPVPGDFNADGKLDLAVATGNGLSVFL